jgi:hypothetical protein
LKNTVDPSKYIPDRNSIGDRGCSAVVEHANAITCNFHVHPEEHDMKKHTNQAPKDTSLALLGRVTSFKRRTNLLSKNTAPKRHIRQGILNKTAIYVEKEYRGRLFGIVSKDEASRRFNYSW